MGNVYSAQNIAAYLIYELNEKDTFINLSSLQQLLAKVEGVWKHSFGHGAYLEECYTSGEYKHYIKDIYDAYKEFGNQHLSLPAKEWHLEFGQFQLVHRTYAVPAFTKLEKFIIDRIIEHYRKVLVNKAS